ncbi:MAG: hypothetical protein FJ088_04545 [Deltaproteobacteria bacterium]|nr:hypothetical protein [Deltaproteobacteria bacterium]
MEKGDLRRTCLGMFVGVILLTVVGSHLYSSIASDALNPDREIQSVATALLFFVPVLVIVACTLILFLQSMKTRT